jgi:diaphanous 1
MTFCVPDEWYRRSKFRVVPAISHEPTEETIKRLADLRDKEAEEEEEEDAEAGTAKQKDGPYSPPSASSPLQSFNSGTEWRGTVAQRRLSSMFDGWKAPPETPTTTTTSPDRKSVSEPMLIDQMRGNGLAKSSGSESTESSDSELDSGDFEEMLVSD